MRVVLADAHSLIRAGIRALLNEMDVAEVFEAADAGTLQSLMRVHRPDVAVVDFDMFGPAGAIRSLRQQYPRTAFIMLLAHADEQAAREALQDGANGVLVERDVISELRHALAAMNAGQSYISSSIRMAKALAHVLPSTGLTPRQHEILKLIAGGLTSRQIAKTLGVHIKTVESHRTDLMRRLGIHNVAGLVRYAIRHGLLQPNGE